jgi:F0F1-type ATP synthase membrane subunit b/b'
MSYEEEITKELISQIHLSFNIRKIILALFLLMSSIFFLIYGEEIFYILESIVLVFIWLILVFIFDPIIKKQKSEKSLENINFLYVLLEFFILIIAIYYAGSISGIGIIFYILALIYAYNYLSKKRAFLVNAFAIVLLLGLVSFEFFNLLPHRYNFYYDLFANPQYVFVTTLTFCLFLIFLGWTLNFFINMLRQRNAAILNKYKEIQEIKDSLEIRVEARKKELEELSQNLKVKVKEKKEELQRKIDELEKANKKIVERELKILELKKELKGFGGK